MAPRLTTALLALSGAAVLGVGSTMAGIDATSPASVAGPSGWMIPGLLALSGVAVLVLALAIPHPSPIAFGLGLLGAGFLIGLPGSGPWHSLTPLAGGWLLAVAELAYWSVDFEVSGHDRSGIYVRRVGMIAALVAGGVALAVVPEIDFAPLQLAGIELTVAGLLGGAALIAVAAALAWRLRPIMADDRPSGIAEPD